MVSVRVGQYQIIQSGNFLFLEIVLDRCAFGIVPRINQHGVSAAGDERGVPLSHIHKMDFHLIGVSSVDRGGNGKNESEKNGYGQKHIQNFPGHFFHGKAPS